MGQLSDDAHRGRVLTEAGKCAEAIVAQLIGEERGSSLDEMFNEAAEDICVDEGLIEGSTGHLDMALDEYAAEIETMTLCYVIADLQKELTERVSRAL